MLWVFGMPSVCDQLNHVSRTDKNSKRKHVFNFQAWKNHHFFSEILNFSYLTSRLLTTFWCVQRYSAAWPLVQQLRWQGQAQHYQHGWRNAVARPLDDLPWKKLPQWDEVKRPWVMFEVIFFSPVRYWVDSFCFLTYINLLCISLAYLMGLSLSFFVSQMTSMKVCGASKILLKSIMSKLVQRTFWTWNRPCFIRHLMIHCLVKTLFTVSRIPNNKLPLGVSCWLETQQNGLELGKSR